MSGGVMAAPPESGEPGATSDFAEIPLRIQDYSCANSFEMHVKIIEQYVAFLFDSEPLLQSFLVAPSSATSSSSTVSDEEDEVVAMEPFAYPSSPSPNPVADSTSSAKGINSTVFGKTLTLYAPSSSNTGGTKAEATAATLWSRNSERSVAVEVHVCDTAHPITQQFYTPLFFLIKKIAVSAAYREDETNYLLSLLSTAVRQALQHQRDGSVLRISCLSATMAAAGGGALPSPFVYPDGCAPCFAPSEDSFKQVFVGVAPPTPMHGALPPGPPPPMQGLLHISHAEWVLRHQRAFTTHFLSDAFGSIPEHCQCLADYIDLFLLHLGHRSRIRSDDFDGICVSLWKAYVLPMPWKFLPYRTASEDEHNCPHRSRGDPPHGKADGVDSAAAPPTALTWSEVLTCENQHTKLLCGDFTHSFGTAAPPLKHIRFHFQWNQLQDVEAHEVRGRASHLDPFHYTTAAAPSRGPGDVSVALTAQRKCFITAQAVLRSDADIRHGVSEFLNKVVIQGYFNPLVSATAAEVTPPSLMTRGRAGEGDNASTADPLSIGHGGTAVAHMVRETPSASPSSTIPTAGPSETGSDRRKSDDSTRDRRSVRELYDMAARIVGWTGAKVALQASLIRRFATAPDQPMNGTTERGSQHAKMAPRSRGLGEKLEAHQRLFPTDSGATGGSTNGDHRGECGESGEVDLRNTYFPESFFSRFAFLCVSHLPHPADVHVLWSLCIGALQQLLSDLLPEQRSENWQRIVDCLSMPVEDPPVDVKRPLLIQKLQLLRFSLEARLQPTPYPGNISDSVETTGDVSRHPPRYLITNGEVLVVPPPLPQPPATTDVILQRAMELNALGASVVENATPEWLQSDGLYNDMCLFLYVNNAHEGRAVRFPDFVQWHSPRDFVDAASVPSCSTTAASHPLDDNEYLSERMQWWASDEKNNSCSIHVWWSLWKRAVPRSYDDIVRNLFQPLEQATQVLTWMAAIPLDELLQEVGNASVANALHRMLCHRFILGKDVQGFEGRDDGARDRVGRGTPPTRLHPSTSFTRLSGLQRIAALHRYLREKSMALTKDVAAASVLSLSEYITPVEGTAERQRKTGSDAVMAETLKTLYASAVQQLGEIEVALSNAIALRYLLGFSADAEMSSTVQALSSPVVVAQQQQQTASLQTRTVTVSMSTWATAFVKQFVRPETRELQECMVRLTCMAERPLDTCGCFQQLLVHRDVSRTLRLALALTEEVL